MENISYEEFLKHAKRTKALIEIAKYYDNPLLSAQDVLALSYSV